MKIYTFVLILMTLLPFYIKKQRIALLFISMLSSFFLILNLPLEVELAKYFLIGVAFMFYCLTFLLIRTFPTLEMSKKIIGKRYSLFFILIAILMLVSLLNILEINIPNLLSNHAPFIQGAKIADSGLIILVGILAVAATFFYTSLREGGGTDGD